MRGANRIPILIGASGARVFRVERGDGSCFIEKHAPASEIDRETAVLKWCEGRLPVPEVIEQSDDILKMTVVPGLNLTEVSPKDAVSVLVEALFRIHAVPVGDCPFSAGWSIRLGQARERMRAGLMDQCDFDEENLGRNPTDMLAELESFPALPDVACFTHGDACLPNFLSHQGRLTGIVDWSRAGVTHPAQDWALAMRSVRSNFGLEAERMLREHMPVNSTDEDLLRRFRLLDEFF